MRVLVTGSHGMLGSALVPALRAADYEVIAHCRSGGGHLHADLSDADRTRALLDHVRPDVIVNLVALANVDACEESPKQAFQANVRTAQNLAAWVVHNEYACHLIHLSTDHVYDGPGPHREDAVQLTNYYAYSKYVGELAATRACATILRTNFFGPSACSGRESFSDWLIRGLSNGEMRSVFEDVFFTPLGLDTLVELIEVTIRRKIPGTYNVGSKDGMSKADFAYAIAKVMHLRTSAIVRTSVDAAGLRAYRPRDMRMDSSLFTETFGVTLPSIAAEIESLGKCYDIAINF